MSYQKKVIYGKKKIDINKLGLSCAKLRLTFAKSSLWLARWLGNTINIAGAALGNFYFKKLLVY